MAQEKYVVSRNARHPYDLDDGRAVVAGDVVTVDPAKNQGLIEDGILVKPKEKPKAKPAAEKKEDDS